MGRMLRRLIAAACVVMALAAPAAADEPTPLWSHGHEKLFGIASDVEVGVLLALDAKDGWWKTGAREKLAHVCSLAIFPLTEWEKRQILRPRPDGSDRYSSPSGHSGAAFASASGWRYGLAFQVPFLRQSAGKHYLTDTIAGSLQGAGVQWLCDRLILRR